MCQLIACKKGTDKNSEFLFKAIRTASIRNDDGIGYAYKKNKQNKVFISKGYKEVEFFISCLKKKKLTVNDELIIHLRIGNKGAKTAQMTHPFVLSNDTETILTTDEFVELGVMAHNGTLFDYAEYTSSFSDTFYFVQKFMYIPEIQSLLKRDVELFTTTFKSILRSNKLAFIFPDSPLVTIGDFKEDEGYLFSNDSYKRTDFRDEGGYATWFPKEVGSTRLNFDDSDDDDPDERVAALPPARQSSMDFRHSHAASPDKNQLAIIQKLVAEGKATKLGDRVRDSQGLLEADSKMDIIPPSGMIGMVPIHNKSMKRWLHPSAGNIVYVPLKYMDTQFERSFFTPAMFNYKHFTFYSPLISEAEFTISSRYIYKIHQFDTDRGPKERKAAIHLINVVDYNDDVVKNITNILWMSSDEIMTWFTPTIIGELRNAYLTVFRLVQRFHSPSKNLYNLLVKAIKGAESKNKVMNINFKNVEHLSLLGMKIYANYIILNCYEYDIAKKMFYEVQDEDKDPTIDFREALEAFNTNKVLSN